MKLLIASDIHGSAFWCRKLMDLMQEEQPDCLVLLGDILYHGPRNALPRDYDSPAVAAMLNEVADYIIAVRGNCDAEVDQMVLSFPCMGDYAMVFDEGMQGFSGNSADDVVANSENNAASVAFAETSGSASDAAGSVPAAVCRQIMFTHGHVFGPQNIPPHRQSRDGQPLFALVSGHTHVKTNEVHDGVLLVNPGSVSIPKDGTNSCMVYENGVFTVRELVE